MEGSSEEEFLHQLHLSKCVPSEDPIIQSQSLPKTSRNCRYRRYTPHLSAACVSNTSLSGGDKLTKKVTGVKGKRVNLTEKIAKLKRSAADLERYPSTEKVKVIRHTQDETDSLVEQQSSATDADETLSNDRMDKCKSKVYHCKACQFSTFDKEKYDEHKSSTNHIIRSEIEAGTNRDMLRAEKEKWKDLTMPAKCSVCFAEYVEREKFIRHARTHSKFTAYKCVRCDSTFNDRDYLKSHLKRHLGVRSIKCDLCTMTFSKTRDLESHLMAKHGKKDERPRNFKCTECGEAFFSKAAVNRHMRWHTGYRPEKCLLCGQNFHSKYDLEEHKRVHSGEKPYKCKVCDYAARTRQLLKRHVQIHTDEKPYTCKHCKFSCRTSSALKRHMHVHTGKKIFKCPYCGMRCSNIENLRKHVKKVKKHKGLRIYPCSHCMSYSTDDGAEYLLHMKQYHFPYLDLKVATAAKLAGICIEESTTEDQESDGEEEMATVSGGNIFEGTSELLRHSGLSQDALNLDGVRRSLCLPELGLRTTIETFRENDLRCLDPNLATDGCSTSPIEKGDIFLSSMAPVDGRDPCKAEAFASSGPFEEETSLINQIPGPSEDISAGSHDSIESLDALGTQRTNKTPSPEKSADGSKHLLGQGYLSVLIKLDAVPATLPAPPQVTVPLTLVVNSGPAHELNTEGVVGKILNAADLQPAGSPVSPEQAADNGTRAYILASDGLLLANVGKQPIGNVIVPTAFKPIRPKS